MTNKLHTAPNVRMQHTRWPTEIVRDPDGLLGLRSLRVIQYAARQSVGTT